MTVALSVMLSWACPESPTLSVSAVAHVAFVPETLAEPFEPAE